MKHRAAKGFIIAAILGLFLQACQATGVGTAPATGEEQALLTKGDTARALGRYEQAEEYYTQAAGLSKGAVRAHLELADIHRGNGDEAAARHILKEAYTLNPRNLEAAKGYAQSLLRAGETQEAAHIAADVSGRYPHDVRLLNLHGIALDRLGRHAEAQKLYSQAMEESATAKDREVTANNHALSLVASREYDAAIHMVETHIPDARSKTSSRQLLALIYGIKGDTDSAYELGLRDLSLLQVNENLRFYGQLRDGLIPMETLFMPAE